MIEEPPWDKPCMQCGLIEAHFSELMCIDSLKSKLALLAEENAALIQQLKARANADPGYGVQRQQVAEIESRLDSARSALAEYRAADQSTDAEWNAFYRLMEALK